MGAPSGLTWRGGRRGQPLPTLAAELGGVLFGEVPTRRALHASGEGRGRRAPADLEASPEEAADYPPRHLSCDRGAASVSFSGKVKSVVAQEVPRLNRNPARAPPLRRLQPSRTCALRFRLPLPGLLSHAHPTPTPRPQGLRSFPSRSLHPLRLVGGVGWGGVRQGHWCARRRDEARDEGACSRAPPGRSSETKAVAPRGREASLGTGQGARTALQKCRRPGARQRPQRGPACRGQCGAHGAPAGIADGQGCHGQSAGGITPGPGCARARHA